MAVAGWGDRGVELGIGQIAVFAQDCIKYLDLAQPDDQLHIIR